MQQILFEYEMHPTTWVYLSSLMIIGIYFKFHRLLSVRNLDLLGLIAFSPGLAAWSRMGSRQLGYNWLFVVGGAVSGAAAWSTRSWSAGRCWSRTSRPAA